MNIQKKALKAHKKLGGKLNIENADHLNSQLKLSMYYTPGVGAVSKHIAQHPDSARELTGLGKTVAIISDGSAVLGLGNLGPQAALPVMEGKAMLFKEFADLNAFPIVLKSQKTKDVVKAIVEIAPSFGGINLEDIAAPVCFEVERELKKKLDIPVFHDDQHGTAIVVSAALTNASKVVGKKFEELKVVILGAGAAGHAISMQLKRMGVRNILVLDRQGIIYKGRPKLRWDKKEIANKTNPRKVRGSIEDALAGAAVFIGVSGPHLVTQKQISLMADKAIVFALSNPTPEIMPDKAKRAGAFIVATGRSDFPNQVNNALVFPAIFRRALDNRVKQITDKHKIAASKALASLIKRPTQEMLIPRIGDNRVLRKISKVIN